MNTMRKNCLPPGAICPKDCIMVKVVANTVEPGTLVPEGCYALVNTRRYVRKGRRQWWKRLVKAVRRG
jgi:hypothetical protein